MAGVKSWCSTLARLILTPSKRCIRTTTYPWRLENWSGKTKIVATKVLASPQGAPPFYRIAEIHFPSMEALEACAASAGAKETLAHAVSISTGGRPIFLVAAEESFTF